MSLLPAEGTGPAPCSSFVKRETSKCPMSQTVTVQRSGPCNLIRRTGEGFWRLVPSCSVTERGHVCFPQSLPNPCQSYFVKSGCSSSLLPTPSAISPACSSSLTAHALSAHIRLPVLLSYLQCHRDTPVSRPLRLHAQAPHKPPVTAPQDDTVLLSSPSAPSGVPVTWMLDLLEWSRCFLGSFPSRGLSIPLSGKCP